MHPQNALVLASTSSGLAYMRGAMISPFSVAALVFWTCMGIGYAGLLGALVALATMTTGIAGISRVKLVQRHLDREIAERQRAHRESARMRTIAPCGALRMKQYIELRDLVIDVEKNDPGDARRFELEDLLDHYVHLAVCHQRCLDAVRLAGMPSAPPRDEGGSKRRREIVERRLKHREECLARVQRLAEEIESVDELVRLVAQRAACPSAELDLDREIERRLWELDEVEAAMHQLSA